MRQPPFGTAQREVLLKLTTTGRRKDTWSVRDGLSLYENRALTDALCQGLVLQGYLSEELDGTVSVYTVTDAGFAKARQLRRRL